MTLHAEPLPETIGIGSHSSLVEGPNVPTSSHLQFPSSPRVDTKSGKYLLGKDGWIFLDRDTNHVVDQMTGKLILSDAQLDAWTEVVADRRNLLGRHGANHYFLVAPNKKAIYAEYGPDGLEISPWRPVFQLETRLNDALGVSLVYPSKRWSRRRRRGRHTPRPTRIGAAWAPTPPIGSLLDRCATTGCRSTSSTSPTSALSRRK